MPSTTPNSPDLASPPPLLFCPNLARDRDEAISSLSEPVDKVSGEPVGVSQPCRSALREDQCRIQGEENLRTLSSFCFFLEQLLSSSSSLCKPFNTSGPKPDISNRACLPPWILNSSHTCWLRLHVFFWAFM